MLAQDFDGSLDRIAAPACFLESPFRVLPRLRINASFEAIEVERDRVRNRVEKGLPVDRLGADWLPPLTEAAIETAVGRLNEGAVSRFVEEVLWFWPLSGVSDQALDAIGKGDVRLARGAWDGVTDASVQHLVAHNLATLDLLLVLDGYARVQASSDAMPAESITDFKGAMVEQRRHLQGAADRWLATMADDAFWEAAEARRRAVDHRDLGEGLVAGLRGAMPEFLLLLLVRLGLALASAGYARAAAPGSPAVLVRGQREAAFARDVAAIAASMAKQRDDQGTDLYREVLAETRDLAERELLALWKEHDAASETVDRDELGRIVPLLQVIDLLTRHDGEQRDYMLYNPSRPIGWFGKALCQDGEPRSEAAAATLDMLLALPATKACQAELTQLRGAAALPLAPPSPPSPPPPPPPPPPPLPLLAPLVAETAQVAAELDEKIPASISPVDLVARFSDPSVQALITAFTAKVLTTPDAPAAARDLLDHVFGQILAAARQAAASADMDVAAWLVARARIMLPAVGNPVLPEMLADTALMMDFPSGTGFESTALLNTVDARPNIPARACYFCRAPGGLPGTPESQSWIRVTTRPPKRTGRLACEQAPFTFHVVRCPKCRGKQDLQNPYLAVALGIVVILMLPRDGSVLYRLVWLAGSSLVLWLAWALPATIFLPLIAALQGTPGSRLPMSTHRVRAQLSRRGWSFKWPD